MRLITIYCLNPNCSCNVESPNDVCGEECGVNAVNIMPGACSCGHLGCQPTEWQLESDYADDVQPAQSY